MTWRQMRALDVGWDDKTTNVVTPNGLGSPNDEEAAGLKVDEFDRLIEVDTYDNVDDYESLLSTWVLQNAGTQDS